MIQSLFYIMIIDDQEKALKCASAACFTTVFYIAC